MVMTRVLNSSPLGKQRLIALSGAQASTWILVSWGMSWRVAGSSSHEASVLIVEVLLGAGTCG